jgi:hypothetical protein
MVLVNCFSYSAIVLPVFLSTGAWGFEKPSTSGVPQKVKTISWEQGIGGIGVKPQLKKLTVPLIAFFHALELDLSNCS